MLGEEAAFLFFVGSRVKGMGAVQRQGSGTMANLRNTFIEEYLNFNF